MNIDRPFLCVIIPTYNRAPILKACFEALARQTVPFESFEVIVGNDGSSDNTLEVLESFGKNSPYRLRYFSQKNRGPNAVRNRAIEMTDAPVVVFFNDDTIADSNCLFYHIKLHEEHPEEHIAVLGRLTIDPYLPYSPFSKIALDLSFDQWKDRRVLDWRAFYTCNLSVKRKFLLEYGLFDEEIWYNDDIELGARLGRHGLKIIYCPESLGYHRHLLGEEDYLKIAVKEGKGLAVWYRKKPFMVKELQALNFPPVMPLPTRLKYLMADMIFHGSFRKLWLDIARRLVKKHEPAALKIYLKCYQAIKRESIRRELRKGSPAGN